MQSCQSFQKRELFLYFVASLHSPESPPIVRMPNMSDAARKRTLADWVVKTKKQIVKLYAVTKWSRDANTVQKCMVSFVPFHLKYLRLIPRFRTLPHSS